MTKTYRWNPSVAFRLCQNSSVTSAGFCDGRIIVVGRIVVVGEEGGLEADPVDAAAACADGDVVAHSRTTAVGARVAPLVRPGRKSGTGCCRKNKISCFI